MSTNGTTHLEQIQQRLNDPKTAQSLNRLLDHLDLISFTAEAMEGFVGRGDEIADSLADGVQEMRESSAGQGQALEMLKRAPGMIETGARLTDAAAAIDVDELEQSRILERLTDPQTLELLNRLLDRLPMAAFLLESLEEFIARGDTIAENLADAVSELRTDAMPVDQTPLGEYIKSLPKLKEAADRMLDSGLLDEGFEKVIDAGVSMIDHGMMDQDVVSTLGKVGKQAVETYQKVSQQPVAPIGGAWALMRATKDPDVQRTLGFAFAFLKEFAKHLK